MLSDIINNRYQLESPIGHGGMGVVYRVQDRLRNERVALKSIDIPLADLDHASHQSNLPIDVSLAHDFQVLASLRHPNIVSVLDFGFYNGRVPYYTMELIEEPLNICEVGKQGIDKAVQFLIQLLQALRYLHVSHNIIHRDLKPSNILVQGDVVKVLDFGLAIDRNAMGMAAGTEIYMSPELKHTGKHSVASDLYAVGVIAYEMLVGALPFENKSEDIHSDWDKDRLKYALAIGVDNLSSAQHNAYTAEKLFEIIETLLDSNPSYRYQDAATVIQKLSAAISQPVPTETIPIIEGFLQAAPFVGREPELETLKNALNNVVNNQPSTWLVGGESGVGKSRLLRELRIHALVQGAMVLTVKFTAKSSAPYAVWREAIEQLALVDTMNEAELATLQQIVPDIYRLASRTGHDSRNTFKASLADVIIPVFLRQQQPVLLLVEDLHWLAPSSPDFQLLKRLIEACEQQPIMIVCTYRTDEAGNLMRELSVAQEILLHRLNAEDMAALTEKMLGELRHQQTIQTLMNTTQGNPFFAIEVLRSLAHEAGGLSKLQSTNLNDVVLPVSITDIMKQRLNQLADLTDFLHFTAVVGHQIDIAILESSPFGAKSTELLQRCAAVSVLRVENNRWLFDHDMIRKIILESIPTELLAKIQCQVAEAIETAYSNIINSKSEHAVNLAYHWQQAGNTAKAQHYFALAGQYALDKQALADARNLLSQALELLSDTPENHKPRLQLKRQLARALDGLGQFEEAREFFQSALDDARALQDVDSEADALTGLGVIGWRLNQLEDAFKYLDAALALYRELGDLKGQSRCLGNLGNCYFDQAKYGEATECHTEALELSRQIKDKHSEATDLGHLGNVYLARGMYEEALDYLLQALQLQTEIGDKRGQGVTYSSLGHVYDGLNKAAEANEVRQKGLSLTREVGSKQDEGVVLAGIGAQYNRSGQYEKARQTYTEAIEIFTKLGQLQFVSYLHGNWGHMEYLIGGLDEAERRFKEARIHNQNPQFEVYALNQLGHNLTDSGKADEAIHNHIRAFIVSRNRAMENDEGYSLYGLAHAYWIKKEFSLAIELLKQAIEIARKIKSTSLLAECKPALGLVYVFDGLLNEAQSIMESDDKWAGDIATDMTYIVNALIKALLNDSEGAICACQEAIKLAESQLDKTPLLYHSKYSIAYARAILMVIEYGDSQALIEDTQRAFEYALKNCAAVGLKEMARLVLDTISPLDTQNSVEQIITYLT